MVGLKALTQLKDFPILQADNKQTVKLGDTKATIKFSLVDFMGTLSTGITNAKVTLVSPIGTSTDITKQAKLNKDNNEITYTPAADLTIGRYQVVITTSAKTANQTSTFNSTFKVVDTIKVSSVSYKMVSKKSFPSSFNETVNYPSKISKIKEGQDGYYLHMAVSASFAKSKEQL